MVPQTGPDVAQVAEQAERLRRVPGGLRHRGDDRLDKSLAGATTRPLADALAWDRRDPRVDLGPVVAVSLACWGFRKFGLGKVAPYDVLRSVG